jgi:hypothetical protein
VQRPAAGLKAERQDQGNPKITETVRQPDAWLCSYPKSGRTWMRFALANLMDDLFDLQSDVDTANMFRLIPNDDGPNKTRPWKTIENFAWGDRDGLPLIAMSHLPWRDGFSTNPVVLLIRNPAASLVSRFFHMSRHAGQFKGGLPEFARDEFFGVPGIVSYFASWEPHADDPNVSVVTYEELRAEPLEPFGWIVRQLGIDADQAALERALEASSADRMRAVEKRAGVGQPNEYDRNDPEALRVRNTGSKSWRDEIDDETLDFLLRSLEADRAATSLLERFDLMPVESAADR